MSLQEQVPLQSFEKDFHLLPGDIFCLPDTVIFLTLPAENNFSWQSFKQIEKKKRQYNLFASVTISNINYRRNKVRED